MIVTIPLLDTPQSGGIRVLVEIANGLNAKGHRCLFVIPHGTKPLPFRTSAEITKVGLPLPYVPNVRNFINAAFLGFLMPKSDIILGNSWLSAFPTYLSAKRNHSSGFYFIQHDERLFFSNNLIGRAKKRLVQESYKLPLQWITNSTWLQNRLRSEFNRLATVINPGVDTGLFKEQIRSPQKKRLELRPITIVSVGRSLQIKGLIDLLEAMEITTRTIEVKLILITQEDLMINATFPVQIIKPSSDQDMVAIYQRADIFVFPSWYEGFGLPPLEAMACGIPVVTADCGGVRDYVQDGYNALVTPIKDPVSLADAIQKIAYDPMLANHLSHNGLETTKEFGWDAFVNRIERVFLDYSK